MPKTPIEDELPETAVENSESVIDQRLRSYYYDDACGYEVYHPDADFDDDAPQTETSDD